VDEEGESGFLSINRAMSLDSVEVDLSQELQAPTRPILQTQVEAAWRGRAIGAEAVNGASAPRWRLVPTRREQAKWDRAAKAATGGSDVILRESKSRVQQGDPKVLAARSREDYLQLKQRLQWFTLGIGGVGVISAYISYTPEIAVSFGAGLIGSLVYLRMLGTSIDSLAGGTGETVKSAAAQPRLLIPVVLVMMYNRWNQILVEKCHVLFSFFILRKEAADFFLMLYFIGIAQHTDLSGKHFNAKEKPWATYTTFHSLLN
ncbi:hypothetical protein ACJX0J_035320, partial [Zea mays]